MNQRPVRAFQLAQAGNRIRELLSEICPGAEYARYVNSNSWAERASSPTMAKRHVWWGDRAKRLPSWHRAG